MSESQEFKIDGKMIRISDGCTDARLLNIALGKLAVENAGLQREFLFYSRMIQTIFRGQSEAAGIHACALAHEVLRTHPELRKA